MHASVETIYQAIYLQARGELKQELKRAMRQGRTARRPQGGQGRKPRFREPMAAASQAPGSGTRRSRAWEGDLITRQPGKSAIGTLVRRTTRFTTLLHHPTGTTPNTSAGHHRQDAAPAQTPAQQPDLGPGSGTRPAQTDRRLAGHGRLLHPHLPPVAWRQRTPTGSCPVLPQSTDLSIYPEDRRGRRGNSTTGHTKPSGS